MFKLDKYKNMNPYCRLFPDSLELDVRATITNTPSRRSLSKLTLSTIYSVTKVLY